VGYDNVKGYLKGGIKAWENAGEEVDIIPNITPHEFEKEINNPNINILDVRKKSEYYAEHIIHNNVINVCLDNMIHEYSNVIKNNKYYVHCAGGYRSVIAISILKTKGYKNLINVDEGFAGIKQCENIKTSAYLCPTTML